MVVALHDSANADAGFDVDACYNQGVQLNASGGISYSWEPSFFVNHPTLANPLAFPNDDMTFTVQVTDSNGCIDFDDININVFIANAGNDTIICNGDSIQKNIGGVFLFSTPDFYQKSDSEIISSCFSVYYGRL